MGIIQENENEVDGMCRILEKLHEYVPKHCELEIVLLENGLEIEYENYKFCRLLLAGDQLTSARICGAQALRSHGDNSLEKLSGFVPATMDWHARVVLLKVYNTYIPILITYTYACRLYGFAFSMLTLSLIRVPLHS